MFTSRNLLLAGVHMFNLTENRKQKKTVKGNCEKQKLRRVAHDSLGLRWFKNPPRKSSHCTGFSVKRNKRGL